MSDLIEALKNHIVTREIDLTDLDDGYRDADGQPLILTVRVNLTVGMNRQSAQNLIERNRVRQEPDPVKRAALLRLADDAVYQWWADVLLMDPDEVRAFQAAVPTEHWNWVVMRAGQLSDEYEKATRKKAAALHSTTNAAPANTDQQ